VARKITFRSSEAMSTATWSSTADSIWLAIVRFQISA
jgi:hypothetical protein